MTQWLREHLQPCGTSPKQRVLQNLWWMISQALKGWELLLLLSRIWTSCNWICMDISDAPSVRSPSPLHPYLFPFFSHPSSLPPPSLYPPFLPGLLCGWLVLLNVSVYTAAPPSQQMCINRPSGSVLANKDPVCVKKRGAAAMNICMAASSPWTQTERGFIRGSRGSLCGGLDNEAARPLSLDLDRFGASVMFFPLFEPKAKSLANVPLFQLCFQLLQ